MATRIPVTIANSVVSSVVGLVDAGASAGEVKVYAGAQPATASDPATGTLLVTVTLADPAFDTPSGATASLDATPAPSGTVVADGTPGWYRVTDSDGNTVYDGSIPAADPVTTGQTFEVVAGTFAQGGV